MFILRFVGLIVLLSLAICLGAYLMTGDARYKRWAGLSLRFGLAVALAFFAIFVLERVLAPIL